jgi:hypothetical protein
MSVEAVAMPRGSLSARSMSRPSAAALAAKSLASCSSLRNSA